MVSHGDMNMKMVMIMVMMIIMKMMMMMAAPAGWMGWEELEIVCVGSFPHCQDVQVLLTDP